jgi:hypothetical protein
VCVRDIYIYIYIYIMCVFVCEYICELCLCLCACVRVLSTHNTMYDHKKASTRGPTGGLVVEYALHGVRLCWERAKGESKWRGSGRNRERTGKRDT